ncbi:MAG: OmpA family protein [Magnetococcales bacterium]|nr:OmpA family protein [Magnetococcales bacterium]
MKLLKLLGITLLVMTLAGCVFTAPRENFGERKGYAQWHPQSGNNTLASTGTQCYFCPFGKKVVDSDGDGVMDPDDQCPDTPSGVKVSSDGCPIDSDGDGVHDGEDQCPDTPRGVKVDDDGCPIDSDGDGVFDADDQCPRTPRGAKVDRNGCIPDEDGDGVTDDKDRCPGTPPNLKVNPDGCPPDTDKDGVIDARDRCPGTPIGATVNIQGCWVLQNLNFDTSRSSIKPGGEVILDNAATVFRKNPLLKVEIQGHTDSRGSDAFNQRLSDKRARTVFNELVSRGVSSDRLMTRGFGENRPIANNETRDGRAMNRRVQMELMP